MQARPRAATFSPQGNRAYVSSEIGGTISDVDTSTHEVIDTIDLGARAKPVGVTVSPGGRRVYVANGHGNSVAVIDAVKSKVVATIPVGKRPWGIAVTRDGRRVYTANGLSNDVSVIDTAEFLTSRLKIRGVWSALYQQVECGRGKPAGQRGAQPGCEVRSESGDPERAGAARG